MIVRCPECGHEGRWTEHGAQRVYVDGDPWRGGPVRVSITFATCTACGYYWALTPAELDHGLRREHEMVVELATFARAL